MASDNAGNENITSFAGLSLVGTSAGNYTLTGATGSAYITPASLTIYAVSASKTYNGTIIANATPTFSGLQGSDAVTDLTESYNSANAGSETLSVNPGYVINDSNNGNNYSVTLQTASGTISQADAIISIQGGSVTYNGNAHASTGTATGVESPTPANLSSLLNLYYSNNGGSTFSSSTAVNAGDYEIYYTFAEQHRLPSRHQLHRQRQGRGHRQDQRQHFRHSLQRHLQRQQPHGHWIGYGGWRR